MIDSMLSMIRENGLLVLATASEGAPHCSLMNYAHGRDGREIYLATLESTRKFSNMSKNPEVSLLIDDREAGVPSGAGPSRALTVSGTAAPFESKAEEDEARDCLLRRHPDLSGFLQLPGARVLRVRVRELQLLNGLTESHAARL